MDPRDLHSGVWRWGLMLRRCWYLLSVCFPWWEPLQLLRALQLDRQGRHPRTPRGARGSDCRRTPPCFRYRRMMESPSSAIIGRIMNLLTPITATTKTHRTNAIKVPGCSCVHAVQMVFWSRTTTNNSLAQDRRASKVFLDPRHQVFHQHILFLGHSELREHI